MEAIKVGATQRINRRRGERGLLFPLPLTDLYDFARFKRGNCRQDGGQVWQEVKQAIRLGTDDDD